MKESNLSSRQRMSVSRPRSFLHIRQLYAAVRPKVERNLRRWMEIIVELNVAQ